LFHGFSVPLSPRWIEGRRRGKECDATLPVIESNQKFSASNEAGITQSCVTAGIVLGLVLVLFILSLFLSLSSGMGREKEKEKK
jgi:hypothetical protein